ncbi:MAG: aldo/keto reductase [Candidatus Buchananbacteria bacterium]|nr:aldo/keto reductase [Candidatus Buchananbacteria bacterium]
MEWFERLYFGTWQLGGQFKNLSSAQIESLLLFALESGIRCFDTAAVYGGGSVETVLGLCAPIDATIVTKIPAIRKPDLGSPAPISEFYSLDHLDQSVENSLNRLKRTRVDTVLLHNWLPTWSSEAVSILNHLQGMKNKGIALKVGISLPDSFLSTIHAEALPYIDVIEAPFNPNQEWILNQLPNLLAMKKEVLLRSLFCQGKLLASHPAELLVKNALRLKTSIVIGMTSEEQITHNISYLKGVDT